MSKKKRDFYKIISKTVVILHQKQARDVKTYRPRRDEYVKYRVYESEFYAEQYAPRDTKQRSRKIKYPHCVRYVRKLMMNAASMTAPITKSSVIVTALNLSTFVTLSATLMNAIPKLTPSAI